MRRLALAIAILLPIGCATIPTANLEDERIAESLEEVRAFADAVTRAYNVPPVRVVMTGDRGGNWNPIALIRVNRAVLTAPLPYRDTHVAMLLAHSTQPAETPMSEPHLKEITRRALARATVTAVDILTTVKGLPLPVAVKNVHAALAAHAATIAKNPTAIATNEPHPCDQLFAFMLEFPKEPFDRVAACPER